MSVTSCILRPVLACALAAGFTTQLAAEPERGTVDLGEITMHYRLSGKEGGTPMVLLHGAFMAGDAMIPLAEAFGEARPVVTVDLRAHGRTGDDPSTPLTFEVMADDVATLIAELGRGPVDLFGYSMGGAVALLTAHEHRDLVNRLIILSAPYNSEGWYPELLPVMESVPADAFRGTLIEEIYTAQSPTPEAFDAFVARVRGAMGASRSLSADEVASIEAPTMIALGDADGVRLDHAADFFRLRGGGDVAAAVQGWSGETPVARLLVLPGTTHIAAPVRAAEYVYEFEQFLDGAAYHAAAAE